MKHQVLKLGQDGLSPVARTTAPSGIRCGTFAASPLVDRHLATGSLDGTLHIWDSDTLTIHASADAHDGVINTLGGCGGGGAEVSSFRLHALLMYTTNRTATMGHARL